MPTGTGTYSLPRWRLTRWLADCGPDVPVDIRVKLIGNLFGSLQLLLSGYINTIAVAVSIAVRHPTPPILAWIAYELAICAVRLIVLVIARRAALAGRETPTDVFILTAVFWSIGIGGGVFVTISSGDWVVSSLGCLSAAAMVAGICFRNFSAPRLASAMIVLSLGEALPATVIAGEPLMFVVFLQVPLYVAAMTGASFKLNKMLVATMRAERENNYRAKHDPLTGLLNRHGAVEVIEARLNSACIGESLALLFLDLDSFKAVNDTHGHAAGDRLLAAVAERLRTLTPGEIAARIGGDEFVVLVSADRLRATATAQRLIAGIADVYPLGNGISARVGASIGIAMVPEHGADPQSLFAVADAALYEAKSDGKSRWAMASAQTSLAALRRLHPGKAGVAGKDNAAA